MRLVFQIYVQALFSFYDGEFKGIPTVMIGQNLCVNQHYYWQNNVSSWYRQGTDP